MINTQSNDAQEQINKNVHVDGAVSTVRPSRAMPILDVGFALRNARPELTSTDKHLLRTVAFELGRGTPRPASDEFRMSIGQLADLMSTKETTARASKTRLVAIGILIETAPARSVMPPTYRVNADAIRKVHSPFGGALPLNGTPPLLGYPSPVEGVHPSPFGVPLHSPFGTPLESEEREEKREESSTNAYGSNCETPIPTPRIPESVVIRSRVTPTVDVVEPKPISKPVVTSIDQSNTTTHSKSEDASKPKKKRKAAPKKEASKESKEPPALTYDDLTPEEKKIHDAIVDDRTLARVCKKIPDLARDILITASKRSVKCDIFLEIAKAGNWNRKPGNPKAWVDGYTGLTNWFSKEQFQSPRFPLQGSMFNGIIEKPLAPNGQPVFGGERNAPKVIPPLASGGETLEEKKERQRKHRAAEEARNQREFAANVDEERKKQEEEKKGLARATLSV